MKHFSQQTILNNMSLPPIDLKHKDLKRVDDSAFKSECPSCGENGLFVIRDSKSFVLLVDDYCFFCSRRVHYVDIEPDKLYLEYKPTAL